METNSETHWLTVLDKNKMPTKATGVKLCEGEYALNLSAHKLSLYSLIVPFDCDEEPDDEKDWVRVGGWRVSFAAGQQDFTILKLNEKLKLIVEKAGRDRQETLVKWSSHHYNLPFQCSSEEEYQRLIPIRIREAHERFGLLLDALFQMVSICDNNRALYVIIERIEAN